MTKEEYTNAFFEGAALAPQGVVSSYLIDQLYEARQQVYRQREQIEFMDDVARGTDWTMTCRCCDSEYQPDCELSEMFGAENYCGRSERCCP